jgi:hypothetical protein
MQPLGSQTNYTQNLSQTPIIGKSRQLVTNEPVEFEKSLVEVHQDCRNFTDQFRGIY